MTSVALHLDGYCELLLHQFFVLFVSLRHISEISRPFEYAFPLALLQVRVGYFDGVRERRLVVRANKLGGGRQLPLGDYAVDHHVVQHRRAAGLFSCVQHHQPGV